MPDHTKPTGLAAEYFASPAENPALLDLESVANRSNPLTLRVVVASDAVAAGLQSSRRMMDLLASLEGTGFASWLRESGSIWGYPTVLTLHTVGLGVLVGASTVIDLRLLGAAPGIPLASLRRLFPIMWVGFWINAISGVALFAADATTKGTTTVFLSKLAIIVIAVVVLVSIKRTVYAETGVAGKTTMTVRALAAASLVLWLAAIATGRYMAYV